MQTNTKPKPATPDTTQQVRQMMEEGTARTMGAATTGVGEVMQSCCSTALKGIQDYNSKLLEFTQVNTKSYVEFIQKLTSVRSPSEFLEVSTEHVRSQLETAAKQAKHLAEIAQKVTLSTTEPFKTSLAKPYNYAG